MTASEDFFLKPTITAVLAGDTEAYRRIVRQYELAIRGFLAGQLHHQDDVEDLAQEVFIAAYKNLATFRLNEDFVAWLRGIARNKLKTYFRSRMRRDNAMDRFRQEIVSVLDPELEKLAVNLKDEKIERLLSCISKLPERMRRIVRGGLERRKGAELATELGMNVGALYTMNHRANKLLRECMEQTNE
ncbi:MAG: RNA polymerase factor sigma-70 [Verrucomicrobiales bacterium]|nr:RNA polymerase factor sigma-70 [Verrucomicrobiales bacterium]|tara:strand:+ start:986 stop:1549 length:564 start_codon:yes stop_codon:yes gene_type:complete